MYERISTTEWVQLRRGTDRRRYGRKTGAGTSRTHTLDQDPFFRGPDTYSGTRGPNLLFRGSYPFYI